MHQAMAATLETAIAEIKEIQKEARSSGVAKRPMWPMIVLRSPKGWTGPKQVDGKKTEDFWRSHQVPLSGMHGNPEHIKVLEDWLKSYKPEELFDDNGTLLPELKEFVKVFTSVSKISSLKLISYRNKLSSFPLSENVAPA